MRRNHILGGAAAVAALGLTTGVAFAAGGSASGPAGLDDGQDLQSQAKVTLQDAVTAAQAANPDGGVGEIDLETYEGTLVYNVDVGAFDVKVDAATGHVLASSPTTGRRTTGGGRSGPPPAGEETESVRLLLVEDDAKLAARRGARPAPRRLRRRPRRRRRRRAAAGARSTTTTRSCSTSCCPAATASRSAARCASAAARRPC